MLDFDGNLHLDFGRDYFDLFDEDALRLDDDDDGRVRALRQRQQKPRMARHFTPLAERLLRTKKKTNKQKIKKISEDATKSRSISSPR